MLQGWYDESRDRADLYIIYIAEAHTIDGWQTDSNDAAGIRLRQHRTFSERVAAAKLCAAELGLSIPTLIDGMDNAACEAFSAWPERIFVVGRQGTIRYRGGHGPYDFAPDEARQALDTLLDETSA